MHRKAVALIFVLVLIVAAGAERRKPASITVAATAVEVRAVLFAEMVSLGYQLKSEKKERIVYAREMRLEDYPTTAQAGKTYTDPPQETVIIRLKPTGDNVEISATAEAQYRDNLGLTRAVDLSHDPVLRPRLQAALDDVKIAYAQSEQRRKAQTGGAVAKEEKTAQKPN